MLDIKIKPSNESLDFGKITINLVKDSALFNAVISQSYLSYSFTILTTPKNSRLLKLPQIIESPDNFENFKADIIINGSKEIEADLYIQEANKNYIKLQLKAVDFDIDFLNAKLSSFNFGADITMGATTADVLAYVKSTNNLTYPSTTHVFPMVYNAKFYGTENPNFLGVINNYDAVAGTVVANTDLPVKNKNTIVPYFFLIFILKKIFESQSITVKGSFIDDVNINKLLVHNNFALDQFNITNLFVRASLTVDLSIPTPNVFQKIIFQDDFTFPNEDTGGNYDVTFGKYTIPSTGVLSCKLFNLKAKNYGHSNSLGADPQLLEVSLYIDGILRGAWFDGLTENETKTWPEITLSGLAVATPTGWYFNPEAKINITTVDVGKKMVVKVKTSSTDFAPTPAAVIYNGTIIEIALDNWSDFNIYSKTITPSNHLPNIAAKDFINAFIKGFKLMPFYDKIKKELFLNYYDDIATDLNYNDITNTISAATIKKLDNTGFNVNYNFNGDTLVPTTSPDTSKFQYVGEYNTVAELLTPATVSLLVYVKSVNAYYVSKVTTGITWERYKEGFDDFIIGDGSDSYKIDYAPFVMDNISVDNDGNGTMRDFLLPKMDKKGSSLFYKLGINDPLFKIIIWHGMVDAPVYGQKYPFASSYNITQLGISYGNFILKISDDFGSFYQLFLKNYFNFLLKTKKVEHNYTPEIKSPLNYNFLEKKLIINQRFLTGKLKLKITTKGFENIVAENYKV